MAGDIDVAWQNWETDFMSIMDQCVPKTTIPTKRNLSWLSKELAKFIRARKKMILTRLLCYFSQCFNQSVSPLTDDISMFDSINLLLCPEEFLCTEDKVLEMLVSLDTKKASGRDCISARMLKSTAPSIAYGITPLF